MVPSWSFHALCSFRQRRYHRRKEQSRHLSHCPVSRSHFFCHRLRPKGSIVSLAYKSEGVFTQAVELERGQGMCPRVLTGLEERNQSVPKHSVCQRHSIQGSLRWGDIHNAGLEEPPGSNLPHGYAQLNGAPSHATCLPRSHALLQRCFHRGTAFSVRPAIRQRPSTPS